MRVSPIALVIGIVVIVAGVILATATLTPQRHPAQDIGIQFVNAASKGDDATAMTALSSELQAYVETNCPDGSVSACIRAYAPPEWGEFLSAVYRRSIPEGTDILHIQYISSYEKDKGASGVCIYTRMEKTGETWQITGWSGWVWCGDTRSGLNQLMQADAANHAP